MTSNARQETTTQNMVHGVERILLPLGRDVQPHELIAGALCLIHVA
jgi:hypothetical protein